MKWTALVLTFLLGLWPATPGRCEGAPLSGVERDILAGFSDTDIENLRRVMDPDLWRKIVGNWHLKSPEQKAELQTRLQEYAASPNPQEWAQQNPTSIWPGVKGATAGVLAGTLGAGIPLVTSLFRNLNAAHEIARGGTATVSKFFSTFFLPKLVSQTGNSTVTTIVARWGRIGPLLALGALAGGAAIYGITRLVQNHRRDMAESAHGTDRQRLHDRLSEIAAATSPEASRDPGHQEPRGTVGPGTSPAPATSTPGGAPGIDDGDLHRTDRQPE